MKFALGTAVMGIGFLLMVPLATTIPDSAPLLGITGVMFVFTIAELLLSPVGLSLSTKLAPAAYQTQMVALFFLSVALGHCTVRPAGPVLHGGRPGAVLRHPRRGRDRHRRHPRGDDPVAEAPHGRGPLKLDG